METQFNNRQNDCYETTCGKKLWHSRSVAVCVLAITPDRKVIVTRRGPAMPNHAGKFCMPCGYIDWNETTQQAARRELFEETGILLDESCFLNWDINDDPNKDELQNITFHFVTFLDEEDLENMQADGQEVDQIDLIAPFVDDGKEYAFGHLDRIRTFFKDYADDAFEAIGWGPQIHEV